MEHQDQRQLQEGLNLSRILLTSGRKTVAAHTNITILEQDPVSDKLVEALLIVSHLEDGGAGSHRRLVIFFGDTVVLNPSGVDGGGSAVQYGNAPWKIPLLIPPNTKLKVVFRITSDMVSAEEGVCAMLIGRELPDEKIRGPIAIQRAGGIPDGSETGVTG